MSTHFKLVFFNGGIGVVCSVTWTEIYIVSRVFWRTMLRG